jgi:hypothetical protein
VYDHSEISSDQSIPIQIQALDRVITDPISGLTWDVQEKEISSMNKKIESVNTSENITNTQEIDPLVG